jgi:hypothetical protein
MLEAEAAREGAALEEIFGRALAHFDAELHAARAAVLAPRFKPGGFGMAREILLDLRPDRWQRLIGEAGRQGVAVERLLEHAQLLYLADLDSDRVAGDE